MKHNEIQNCSVCLKQPKLETLDEKNIVRAFIVRCQQCYMHGPCVFTGEFGLKAKHIAVREWNNV